MIIFLGLLQLYHVGACEENPRGRIVHKRPLTYVFFCYRHTLMLMIYTSHHITHQTNSSLEARGKPEDRIGV